MPVRCAGSVRGVVEAVSQPGIFAASVESRLREAIQGNQRCLEAYRRLTNQRTVYARGILRLSELYSEVADFWLKAKEDGLGPA